MKPGLNTRRIPGERPAALGVYVHVPYCQSRCGYCDFNTYVPGETGRGQPNEWAQTAAAEIRLRAHEMPTMSGPVKTVFFGGGTPTLLPPQDLGVVVDAIGAVLGIAPNTEITTEANPETINAGMLAELRAVGFNRLSIGMQSADQSVLRTLDRTHTPGRAVAAANLAREAGFEHISLDLIYGTPGESLLSWEASLATALVAPVDHISAYGLKVETGTGLARRIQRGDVAAVNDDYAAEAYRLADETLSGADLPWYEISNWAQPAGECQHNLGYWRGHDWWGIGPGAHGTIAGRRYWNEKLPAKWSSKITQGHAPTAGTEHLSRSDLLTETVMLSVRMSAGLQLAAVGLASDDEAVRGLVAEGLAETVAPGRLRLTLAGRLLADLVTLRLLARIDSLPGQTAV